MEQGNSCGRDLKLAADRVSQSEQEVMVMMMIMKGMTMMIMMMMEGMTVMIVIIMTRWRS